MDSLLDQLLAPKFKLPSRPKIAEGAACPKCAYAGKAEAGSPEVTEWRQYTWVNPDICERLGIVDQDERPVRECLMISCGRCGYRYREEVRTPELDAMEPS